MFSSFYWLSFFLFISSGLGFLIFWGDAHLHSALSSTKSSALILPSPPYRFFFRLMPAADRGKVRKGILSLSSFTFSLSLLCCFWSNLTGTQKPSGPQLSCLWSAWAKTESWPPASVSLEMSLNGSCALCCIWGGKLRGFAAYSFQSEMLPREQK